MHVYLALLMAVTAALSEASSTCDQNVRLTFLNGGMYMVAKASYDYTGKPKDCADLLHMGNHESGVYQIWPTSRLYENKSVEVYCDMEEKGGGWTLLQRRGNYGNEKDYFNKDWNTYKKGFGDLKKEFWLGNDKIFGITNQKLYTLRIDMKDVEKNARYAEYDTFWIDDENNQYKLHISGYRGSAGDGLTSHHNNQKFSTKDKDNDNHEEKSCAQIFSGGWWFNKCHTSNLNGLNHRGKHPTSKATGIAWNTWKGYYESLESADMKIRPRNFKLPSGT